MVYPLFYESNVMSRFNLPTIHLDREYVYKISSSLSLFTRDRHDCYTARCPVCGDSKKSMSKKRFYIIASQDGNNLIVYCHNCLYSNSFAGYLKQYHNSVYEQYRAELYLESGKMALYKPVETIREPDKVIAPVKEIMPQIASNQVLEDMGLIPLSRLPDYHDAVVYCNDRRIPMSMFSKLYYSHKFKTDMRRYFQSELTERLPDDSRLIIPFYNEAGDAVTMLQGRALDQYSKMRYTSMKFDSAASKVYGLERLNRNKPIYIVEAPLDSLFVDNCLASADSNLLAIPYGDVYIPDNQYRNKAILQQMQKIINAGKKLCIFPKTFIWKDINDAVKDGNLTNSDILNVINSNTYSGMRANIELANLRKLT